MRSKGPRRALPGRIETMPSRRRILAAAMAVALLSPIALAVPAAAKPAPEIDALSRDVDRLESVRAVKDLQRSYAQYRQFGLWEEMAGLYAEKVSFTWGAESAQGRAAVAAWL